MSYIDKIYDKIYGQTTSAETVAKTILGDLEIGRAEVREEKVETDMLIAADSVADYADAIRAVEDRIKRLVQAHNDITDPNRDDYLSSPEVAIMKILGRQFGLTKISWERSPSSPNTIEATESVGDPGDER